MDLIKAGLDWGARFARDLPASLRAGRDENGP